MPDIIMSDAERKETNAEYHADSKPRFLNMPFDEYLDLPGVTQSSLKPLIAKTPLHYRLNQETRREPTASQSTGTFAHSLTLEPTTVLERYVVEPTERFKREARTKEGRIPASPTSTDSFRVMREQFQLDNHEKEIVTQDVFDRVKSVTEAIWASASARELLHQARFREVVLHWADKESGLECKSRCDGIDTIGHVIVDLKTTADIYRFDLLKFGYDVQAAFCSDGYEAMTSVKPLFYIIAVETEPPYCVRVAPVGRVAIMVGRAKYKKALATLVECMKKNEWPGPADPDEWSLPEYEIAKYLSL